MRRRLLSPRLLLRPAVFLLLGCLAALGVGWVLAFTVDPRLAPPRTASAFDGESTWAVNAWSRRGATCVESAREVLKGSWSPWQTTGAPNTPGPGDIPTAWAQTPQDAPGEWLELTYATPVVPQAVLVYETYEPGALVKLSVFKEDGTEVTVWEGADPTPRGAKMGTSRIPVSVDFAVRRVKLYLASELVPGWNEIDAVGLVEAGREEPHWAVRARASSSYEGQHREGPATAVTALLPPGSALATPTPAFASGSVASEARVEAAFGWPMKVVSGHAHVSGATAGAAARSFVISGTTAAKMGMGGGFGPAPGVPGGPGGPNSGIVFLGPGGNPPPAAAWAVPRPRRVLWDGLVVNGALYAIGCWAAYALLVRPRRFLREVGRVKGGRCIACGYDLGYDFVRGCPECGWRRDRAAAGAPARREAVPGEGRAEGANARDLLPAGEPRRPSEGLHPVARHG